MIVAALLFFAVVVGVWSFRSHQEVLGETVHLSIIAVHLIDIPFNFKYSVK